MSHFQLQPPQGGHLAEYTMALETRFQILRGLPLSLAVPNAPPAFSFTPNFANQSIHCFWPQYSPVFQHMCQDYLQHYQPYTHYQRTTQHVADPIKAATALESLSRIDDDGYETRYTTTNEDNTALILSGENFGTELGTSEVTRLQDDQWLNDTIINKCMKWIHDRYLSNSNLNMVTTHWIDAPNARKQRLSPGPIPQMLFVPVHAHNHWQCMIVYKTSSSITIYKYCSLNGTMDDTAQTTLNTRLSQWFRGIPIRSHKLTLSKTQQDGHNCGVYILFVWLVICGWSPTDLDFQKPPPENTPIITLDILQSRLKRIDINSETIQQLRHILSQWAQAGVTA